MGLSTQDKWDVAELLARYAVAIDGEKDVNALLEIYTSDAVFIGPSGTFVGHEGIREWAQRPNTPGLRHTTSNVVVTGDADDAELTAYFTNVVTDLRGGDSKTGKLDCRIHMVGTYKCAARRENGVWRFSKRDCKVDGLSAYPDTATIS